ncbi:MAG: hypothetical protein R2867_47330 [Caldilineaceae bacterium]
MNTHCTEWSWLNGVVDGMALGNHEFDYGPETFADCRNQITYPLLSSGWSTAIRWSRSCPSTPSTKLTACRIGVFAVAGDDFARIVRPELLPENTRWLTNDEEMRRSPQS